MFLIRCHKIHIYQIQFISYFNFRPWNISESGNIPNLHSARTLFVNSFVTITLNGRHFPTISTKKISNDGTKNTILNFTHFHLYTGTQPLYTQSIIFKFKLIVKDKYRYQATFLFLWISSKDWNLKRIIPITPHVSYQDNINIPIIVNSCYLISIKHVKRVHHFQSICSDLSNLVPKCKLQMWMIIRLSNITYCFI